MPENNSSVTDQPAPPDDDSEGWIPYIDTPEGRAAAGDNEPEEDDELRGFTLAQHIQFWAITAVIVSLGVWHQVSIIDESKEEKRIVPVVVSPVPEQEAENEIPEPVDVRPMMTSLTDAVRGYLQATSIEEKSKWVREPERVQSMMVQHYTAQPLQGKKFHRILTHRPATFWSKPFVVLLAEVDDGKKHFLTAEQTTDGAFKVDWETDVHFLPLPWSDFIQPGSGHSTADMRVYARPDSHYIAPYDDSNEYQCFRLISRDDKTAIFAYAKKDSPAWKDLMTYFSGRRKGNPDGEPLMLRIAKSEGNDDRSHFIIEKFLSDRWLHPPAADSR